MNGFLALFKVDDLKTVADCIAEKAFDEGYNRYADSPFLKNACKAGKSFKGKNKKGE